MTSRGATGSPDPSGFVRCTGTNWIAMTATAAITETARTILRLRESNGGASRCLEVTPPRLRSAIFALSLQDRLEVVERPLVVRLAEPEDRLLLDLAVLARFRDVDERRHAAVAVLREREHRLQSHV